MSTGKMPYAVDARESGLRELSILRGKLEKMEYENNIKPVGPRDGGPPDHLSINTALGVLDNDIDQLGEVLSELRARLAVVSCDRVESTNGRDEKQPPTMPVRSKLAAAIRETDERVKQLRAMAETMLMDLDL